MPELAAHSTPISNLPPSLFAVPPDGPSVSPTPPSLAPTEKDFYPATPPIIDPATWEDFPVFRETFLLYITDPAYTPLYGFVAASFTNWSWSTTAIGRTGQRESRQLNCEQL